MSLISVDGRTDRERLHELLALGGERSQVDFKETVDLSDKRGELCFVKDAVAMLNYYPGGYIVIGVDDDGKPSVRGVENDWRQFDGAKLTDKIKKYIDAPFKVVSGRIEEDGHEYIIVCLMSPKEGYPIPFKKLGRDSDNRPIFREGEIVRRNGAKNDTISYSQWAEVLEQHDRLVREEEAKRINTLVDRISESLAEHGKTPPLALGMSAASLDAALRECFERDDRKKLVRFAKQATNALLTTDDDLTTATAIGAFAACYADAELFGIVADGLYAYHSALDSMGRDPEACRLRILNAVYEIGSAAVRSGELGLINPLVNRPYRVSENYIYASWVRDCQVRASRLHEFGDHERGMAVSTALAEMREHPILRPDLPGECDPEGNDEAARAYDLVLNSLCGFDFLYCLCMYATYEDDGTFLSSCPAYPACVAFKSSRTSAATIAVFGNDAKGMKELLPGVDGDRIAAGLRELLSLISNEAMRYGRWVWLDEPGFMRQYLEAHPATEDPAD